MCGSYRRCIKRCKEQSSQQKKASEYRHDSCILHTSFRFHMAGLVLAVNLLHPSHRARKATFKSELIPHFADVSTLGKSRNFCRSIIQPKHCHRVHGLIVLWVVMYLRLSYYFEHRNIGAGLKECRGWPDHSHLLRKRSQFQGWYQITRSPIKAAE